MRKDLSSISYSFLGVSWVSWMWIMSVRTMFPTIVPAISHELNWSVPESDTIIGTFNLSTGFGFFLLAVLAEKTSRKKVILAGFIVSIVSNLLFVSLSEYLFLLSLAASAGFFLGAYLPINTALLTDTYAQEKRGLVIGVHETGASIGQVVGTLLVAVGIEFGWRELYGEWTLFGVIPLLLYVVIVLRNSGIRDKSSRAEGSLSSTWTRTQTVLILLVYVGGLSGLMGLVSVLPVHLVGTYGISVATVALIFTLARVPAPFSQVIVGRLSDTYGRRRVLIVVMGVVAASTVLMGTVPFGWIFVAATAVQFFAGAAFFPVVHSRVSDATPLEQRSSRIGMCMLAGSVLGSGVVPIGIGYIATYVGDARAFLFPEILTFVSLLSAIILKFQGEH